MIVENELRQAFRERSRTVTGWTDPAARVVRGVRRRRRRRLAARTGAAALTVVVLAAGFAQWQGSRTVEPGETVIADATGAEVAQAPSIRYRAPRPDAAACGVDAGLDKVEWITQSAPWGESTGFALRTHAGTRCTLSGRPVLSGVDVATGLRVEVPFMDANPVAANPPRQFPATVDPGEAARVEIRGGACPAGQSPKSYRSLSLSVGGRDLPVPDVAGDLSAVCGAQVSDWFVEPPMQSADGVEAVMEAPATLRRGADFTYSVRIDNPSPTAFALSGCPVHRLGVDTTGGPWHRMDCRVGEIPANSSVRFELTGHIPATTPPGTANLFWLGVLPDGEVMVAILQAFDGQVTITD